ncbi:hypothetical protein RYX36_011484, partial [Vicia faba]
LYHTCKASHKVLHKNKSTQYINFKGCYTTKKGEIPELKEEINSQYKDKRKDAVKKSDCCYDCWKGCFVVVHRR